MTMQYAEKTDLLKNVRNTVNEHEMLKGVKALIIAFSAGPDSVCLLDVIRELYPDINIHMIYINHGLRSAKETRIEENLTKKYAKKFKCSCKIVKIKIKKTKLGTEAAARAERYKAFMRIMQETGCKRIALGHNLDDVVETFLMNLLRGSGARGLRSIPATRPPFIRPLINVKKIDIISYLKQRKLRYCRDRTNLKLDYRRNIIRHQIVPKLLKLNPDLHHTIAREIDILSVDDEYLDKLAEKAFATSVRIEKNHVIVDIKSAIGYNPAIANRVMRSAVRACAGSLDGFESKHFAAIFHLISSKSGSKIDLPNNIIAWREYDKLMIGQVKKEHRINRKIDLKKRSVKVAGLRLQVKIAGKTGRVRTGKREEVFDLDKISLPLKVRTRKDGDTLLTKSGRVKLKKVFQEKKVPYLMRKAPILLCDRRGILWVIGIKRAYRGFVDKDTKKMLVVDFEYID